MCKSAMRPLQRSAKVTVIERCPYGSTLEVHRIESKAQLLQAKQALLTADTDGPRKMQFAQSFTKKGRFKNFM
jgi:hypothetical protein